MEEWKGDYEMELPLIPISAMSKRYPKQSPLWSIDIASPVKKVTKMEGEAFKNLLDNEC